MWRSTIHDQPLSPVSLLIGEFRTYNFCLVRVLSKCTASPSCSFQVAGLCLRVQRWFWTYIPFTHPELSATYQCSQLKLFLPATIALSVRSLLLMQSHCFLLTTQAPHWRACLAQTSQVSWASEKEEPVPCRLDSRQLPRKFGCLLSIPIISLQL